MAEAQYDSAASLEEKIETLIKIANFEPATYNGQSVDGRPSLEDLEEEKQELDQIVQRALAHFEQLFQEEQAELKRAKKEHKRKQKMEAKVAEFE